MVDTAEKKEAMVGSSNFVLSDEQIEQFKKHQEDVKSGR